MLHFESWRVRRLKWILRLCWNILNLFWIKWKFYYCASGEKIMTHMTNDTTSHIYPITEDTLYTLCMKIYMYELTMLTHSISCVHHSIMLWHCYDALDNKFLRFIANFLCQTNENYVCIIRFKSKMWHPNRTTTLILNHVFIS